MQAIESFLRLNFALKLTQGRYEMGKGLIKLSLNPTGIDFLMILQQGTEDILSSMKIALPFDQH